MRKTGLFIVAAAFAAIGAVEAQANNSLSPRQAKKAVKAMESSGSSLSKAIEAAEKETGGKAFSVELANQQTVQDAKAKPTSTAESKDKTADNKANEGNAAYAQVHCLVSGKRIRCALVNLKNDEVVLVRNAGHGPSAFHANAWMIDNAGHYEHRYDGKHAPVDQSYIENNAWPPGRGDRYYGMTAGIHEGSSKATGDSGKSSAASRSYDNNMVLNMPGTSLVLASDLMNANVWNHEGKELGDIDDLAIDPNSACVIYACLEHGGFLGINEKHFAVPSEELTFGRDGEVFINLAAKELETRKGFDASNWPTQADPQFADNGNSTHLKSMTDEPAKVAKASGIIGHEVTDLAGKKVGNVDDLVIDPARGKVAYLIVAMNDGLFQQNYVAVPAAAVSQAEDKCVLNVDEAKFETMPQFTSNDFPNFNSEQWNQRAHESFNVEPYWKESRG
ncbi:MAG TPA: PRC-barrel domain-containing protein [Phycisphaerae bacterium]|nr:PRC-barrel domain-containing protein [Phycisphaerae bacterium]